MAQVRKLKTGSKVAANININNKEFSADDVFYKQ